MAFTLGWHELLAAVVLVGLAYLMVMLFRLPRQRRRGGDAELRREVERLRVELTALRDRVDGLETGVVAGSLPEAAHAAYDYAVQYARQGMIVPEIAARCGISRDEAALIVALHGKRPDA